MIRKFESTVGVWVCATPGAGGVEVWVAESMTGWERSVPVGVHGMGWKGVGVGEAFGAAVTSTKGSSDCAGALLPHPASNKAAMIMIQ